MHFRNQILVLKCRTCTNNAQKVVLDVIFVASGLHFFLGYLYFTREVFQTLKNSQPNTKKALKAPTFRWNKLHYTGVVVTYISKTCLFPVETYH